jgi:hypothetical protein
MRMKLKFIEPFDNLGETLDDSIGIGQVTVFPAKISMQVPQDIHNWLMFFHGVPLFLSKR